MYESGPYTFEISSYIQIENSTPVMLKSEVSMLCTYLRAHTHAHVYIYTRTHFGTLAKARLNICSIKGSTLAVRHTIYQLSKL